MFSGNLFELSGDGIEVRTVDSADEIVGEDFAWMCFPPSAHNPEVKEVRRG
jgi:hypothetical protein